MKYAIVAFFILVCVALFGCGRPDPRSRTVMLVSTEGSCSGTQIKAPSGKDYILSAAHCKPIAFGDGSQILVIDEQRHMYPRKIIAIDVKKDLLLVEGIPYMEGVPIAKSARTGDVVMSFTHGLGLPAYEAVGKLLGPVHTIFIPKAMEDEADMAKCRHPIISFMGLFCMEPHRTQETSMKVLPGSSGGGVLNMSGEIVGVVSAGDTSTFMGELVSLKDIRQFLAKR